jgi:hypothetical protein
MDDTTAPRFATYRYQVVETALATVFELDGAVQRGPLRGRLKRLARLGLPGVGAGKGRHRAYLYEQTAQLAVALALAELGIDPVVIVKLAKGNWETIAPWVRRATDDAAKAGDAVFLTLRPRLMSGPWSEPQDGRSKLPWVSVDGFRRSTVPDRGGEAEGWLCCRNLTADLTRLRASLDRDEADAKPEKAAAE